MIGEFLFFQMNSPSLLSLLRVRSVREGNDPDIDLARIPTRYSVLGRALPPYTKVFFARRLTMINSFFSSHMTMLEHYWPLHKISFVSTPRILLFVGTHNSSSFPSRELYFWWGSMWMEKWPQRWFWLAAHRRSNSKQGNRADGWLQRRRFQIIANITFIQIIKKDVLFQPINCMLTQLCANLLICRGLSCAISVDQISSI